jgi:hypothetical protein
MFVGVLAGAIPLRQFMSPRTMVRLVGMSGFARLILGQGPVTIGPSSSRPRASFHTVIRGFHTVGRASLQQGRSSRGCPERRTITRPRGGGHVENQTRQDHDRHRNRSRRAGRGVRRQHGCRQRRDHVLDDIDPSGHHGGERSHSRSLSLSSAQGHAQLPEHARHARRHAGRAREREHRPLEHRSGSHPR